MQFSRALLTQTMSGFSFAFYSYSVNQFFLYQVFSTKFRLSEIPRLDIVILKYYVLFILQVISPPAVHNINWKRNVSITLTSTYYILFCLLLSPINYTVPNRDYLNKIYFWYFPYTKNNRLYSRGARENTVNNMMVQYQNSYIAYSQTPSIQK